MQQVSEGLHRFFSTDQVLATDFLITVTINITFQDGNLLLDDQSSNAALKHNSHTSQSKL